METGLSIILIQAIHGLVYGMLLFLVASGLTLVFGMMDVLNIAHAGATYPAYRGFILLISFLILATMLYVFMKTRIGINVRAAVSDPEMVNALGKGDHEGM
jgi:branched-chain amino acid transport system permease protein